MHDIWNPWHGCKKISEGCENCYMYFLDRIHNARDGSEIYRCAGAIDYPLRKTRSGAYKIKSGETIRVCMTSDFFLAEADEWRAQAWDVIRMRPDVIFYLLTKRADRMARCLPDDWGDGWENVILNVTAENERRARERVPILLDIPARHRGVMCAPLIGAVDLLPYLQTGKIEQVTCGGENYDGARICDYAWVQSLYEQCRATDTKFTFFETGTKFLKDGRLYTIPNKTVQSEMARKSGLHVEGRPIRYHLTDRMGIPIDEQARYTPHYRARCASCGSKPFCNGCSDCGKCNTGYTEDNNEL